MSDIDWGKPERASHWYDFIAPMRLYVCLLGPTTYLKSVLVLILCICIMR